MSVEGGQDGVERKVKQWSVRRCLQEFCGSTTMHGAARVGNPRSPVLVRIFWLVLLMVAAGWSSYNVTQIILTFLKRPVSTVVTVEYEENLPFPAVTVCNLNQFRFSKYRGLFLLLDPYDPIYYNPYAPSNSETNNPYASPNSDTNNPYAPPNSDTNNPYAPPNSETNNPYAPPNSDTNNPYAPPNSDTNNPYAPPNSDTNNPYAPPNSDTNNPYAPPNSDTNNPYAPPNSDTNNPYAPPNSDTNNPYAPPNSEPSDPYDPETPSPVYSTSSAAPSTAPNSSLYDYDETFHEWLESELKTFLDKFDREQRNKLGHQLDTMLMSCNYQSHECTEKNFTQFWNHKYGNCFTFNKDRKASFVSKSGPIHGLSLVLNTEIKEYLLSSETVGMKVVVHPADAMPFPEDEGIIVSPGVATSVGIRRMDITRTPEPYGRCNDYTLQRNVKVNMYALEYDVGYTDKACQRSCYQRRTIDLCGCCDVDFPCIGLRSTFSSSYDYDNLDLNSTTANTTGPDDDKDGKGATYCNMTESKENGCVTDVRNQFQLGRLQCKDECAPSCSETQFEVGISMGVWPAEPSIKRLIEKLEKVPEEFFRDLGKINSKNFIRDNLVKVEIYFKQLNYEHLQTMPAYDWYRLLSDLGGQMGLWLGFSLLTAMEVLSLLVDLARHAVFKLLHKNRGNKVCKQDRVFTTQTPVQQIRL